ncbi:MAG: hypothetical protein QW453_00620 [Thermoprotei archaeon]
MVEAIFNREFLAAVLPLGVAGVNIQQIAPILTAIYIIGGKAFSLLTLFVPTTLLASLFLAEIKSRMGKTYMFFLFLATITSIVMDLQHLSAGLDNPVNSPPTETLILLLSVVGCMVLTILRLASKPRPLSLTLILTVLTATFGAVYILGNVLTANYGVQFGSTLAGGLATLEPYLGTLAGLAYTIVGGRRIFAHKGVVGIMYIGTLLVGYILEYLVMSNILAGSSIVLGTIIIYDFGFLGVTNSNVLFLVFAAISAFITGCYLFASTLSDKDEWFYYGFAGLMLIIIGLVFDSEVVTTYILLPLISLTLIIVYTEATVITAVRTGEQTSTLKLSDKRIS